jgi:hypothetical protein
MWGEETFLKEGLLPPTPPIFQELLKMGEIIEYKKVRSTEKL